MSSEAPVQARVTRRFSLPPERVFDAWLIPRQFQVWMSDLPQVEVSDVEIDTRPRGSFRFREHRDGKEIQGAGEYLAMDRPHRLVLTWGTLEDVQGRERVTVEIVRMEGGSELTLTQELRPERREDVAQVEAGWRRRLDLLAWEQEERARAEPALGELLQKVLALQEEQSAALAKIRWRTGCLYAWLIVILVLVALTFLSS